MVKVLMRVLKETFVMSLPLAVIMIIVCVFVAPFEEPFYYVRLGVGYVGVVVGQSLFLVGLESSILPIGKEMGKSLIKLKKPVFIIFFGMLFGFFATVAEPALWVLGRQTNLIIDSVNVPLFIMAMSVGVGIFAGFSLFRIMKNLDIRTVFIILYAITFLVIAVVPEQFVALGFDGSGATTGDISVPFLLALGLGVARTLRANNEDDSFGIIGIASVGPILAVFMYGAALRIIHGGIPPEGIYDPSGSPMNFATILLSNLGDAVIALSPLLLAFIPFQLLLIKLPKAAFIRIMMGIVPVFAGLLLFLSSIDFGFAFAGNYIGVVFMDGARPDWFQWLLLGIGFILGVAITLTEPAVTVLGEQLEEMIGIKQMTTRLTLAIGIGFSAMLCIVKIMWQVNILWFLVPLYAIALIMTKFTPKMFVGLAFDSGGVTGGALSSAVLTPLTLGVAQAVAYAAGDEAQSILTNGFGIIAFVSVTPLIAVQVMGIIFSRNR